MEFSPALQPIISWLDKLFSPLQLWLTLFITTSILLFFKSWDFYSALNLHMVEGQIHLVGLIFIVSLTVLILRLIIFINSLITREPLIDSSNLSDEEKAILLFFYETRRNHIQFKEKDGTTIHLEHRGFISTNSEGLRRNSVDVYITPYADKEIRKTWFYLKNFRKLDHDKVRNYLEKIADLKFSEKPLVDLTK